MPGWLVSRRSIVARYGVAVLLVATAAGLCGLINPLVQEESPFLMFTPAVMIAAWYGGLGPGLFATILAGLVGDFFWVGEPYTLVITQRHELYHTLVFLGVGGFISWMSGALERARANAVAANRAKDHFLAVVSHELRNPLAPVMAAVSSLDGSDSLPAVAREDLDTIRRNVALQTRLIDDLLDANRLAHGKVSLRPEACDAHRVLADAVDVCRPQAAAKGVELESDARAENHFVRADPARLQQVFWNLIRNAVKFTPAGGRVSVGTRDAAAPAANALTGDVAPRVRVEVTDTGVGIAGADIARIFEPFEQGPGAGPRQAGGLGLGLSIARALAELHGGRVAAQSEGPGRGSTFVVELPTIGAPVGGEGDFERGIGESTTRSLRSRLNGDGVGAGTACRRILLVEDDPDAGPLMVRLLGRYGYDVVLATDVGGAAGAARARAFDVVISDMVLPDGSGADVLRRVRESGPVRGICVSGHDGDGDACAGGFERHFTKPVDLGALREAIEGGAARQ